MYVDACLAAPHQRKSHLVRQQSVPVDIQCRRNSLDSNFESRVDGPVGAGFIWKSYHDLKHML